MSQAPVELTQEPTGTETADAPGQEEELLIEELLVEEVSIDGMCGVY